MKAENGLIEAASKMVMRGAAEYLRTNNLTADAGALAECCKSWLKIQLPIALRDAKEAFACNMTQVGLATFCASMVQAGIEAAKEASKPVANL